ncbi:tyrosine-protein phosphatase [Micromonospora humi]|uniref:Tyrosine phosphatase family protein n=1 Tax=Micromonospora humi TaxID=745366 RepID=A0A1C5H580_9ACTN|nr:tyrosine-protein phosphatase [Micromonospora humi]SCG41164.1 Tyrosine phosphatase family protein [Micromonospora humi]
MPRLAWPDLRNARDVGGARTADGGRIRQRALVRTDNHRRLGAAGLAALRAYGVSRVLDLRWRAEAEADPSPLAADPRYRLVPACFDPTGDEDIPPDSYRLLVDASRDRLAAAFTAIAQAPPGAVVVHCHGGRDRTGVLVALALHVAGVPVDAIAADYALTEGAPASMITNTWVHLHGRYGGVTDYLLGSGVTPAQISAVRARLTEGSPAR